MTRDPRIDAYIAARAEFARPILEHLRAAVHEACPAAEEGIKWGMPAFLVGGRILANMAAFKAHATFGFWRGGALLGDAARRDAMGQFGRLASIEDLPPREELQALIRKAAEAARSGPLPHAKARPKPEAGVPADLGQAIDATPQAAAAFAAFPPGGRREYVEWVEEAKRPETRARRVAQAAEWIGQGKRRNWKYDTC